MIRKFLNIIIILLVGNCLFSQEIHIPDTINLIEEVFIYAPKNLEETGQKINRLDSLIIENKFLDDISSLLSENTSVFIKSYGKSSLSTASFKGTNASHTKLTWNNVELNSPLMGIVDMSLIPVAISENIKIYYGAASLSKNSNALGGLIELNSSTTWSKGVKAKIVSQVASYSSYDNLGEIRLGNAKVQSVTKLYHSISKNNFPFFNNDITNQQIEYRQNADYLKYGFVQEVYFRFNHKNIISAKFWKQLSDRGVPGLTSNEAGPNNNKNRQNSGMNVYATNYTHYGERLKFELNHGANFQNLNYKSTNYINGVGYLNVVNSFSKSNSIYNSASANYKFNEKAELNAQINYNFHFVNSEDGIVNQYLTAKRQEGGLNVSAYYEIFKNFKLALLLRQDFCDKNLNPFVPVLSAEYFFKNNLSLRASVGRNYNLPSLNDLYLKPSGNPDLKAEIGNNSNLGVSYFLNKKNFSLKTDFELNYNKINNWILWRPTAMGFWRPDNIDAVIASGCETNLIFEYKLRKVKFKNIVNYAFTKSVRADENANPNDQSLGKQLPYIPRHSANLFSQVSWSNFFFNYQWTYFSTRYTSSVAEPGVLVSIYPYFMNDIGIGKNFILKKVDLVLNFKIYNLFNEKYRSVLWQPMPGRNYSLQLGIKLK